MRRVGLALVVTATLVGAGCGASTTGSSSGAAATITMEGSSFSGATSVTIKAGQAVKFDDSNSGGTHILVTGSHGAFTAASGAPSEFASSNGLSFQSGDVKTVTFPTAGTFNLPCLIHPSIQPT